MSSLFVSENNGASQLAEPTRPKRPRSSLACIRCRKKKVKCDFVQPTCDRCGAAGLTCSYATPPRRVDGHAFDQLGDYVEELKERMLKMQSELLMMRRNLHAFPTSTPNTNNTTTTTTGARTAMSSSSSATGSGNNNDHPNQHDTTTTTLQIPVPPPPTLSLSSCGTSIAGPPEGQQQQTSVTWRLSLSSSGLRIDTNIASVMDLHRILLSSINQLSINRDRSIGLSSTSDAIKEKHDKKIQQGVDDENYNSNGDSELSSIHLQQQPNNPANKIMGNSRDNGYFWKGGKFEKRNFNQEGNTRRQQQLPSKSKMNNLMQTCYHSCFVVYQIIDKDTFVQQYMREELDPLLMNSINAWMSKHGCIFHGKGIEGGVKNAYNPVSMGQGYFKKARRLLRKRFDVSSPTTIHALLHLYIYQLSNEQSHLAYLYIGLAIRMAQDLKFHKKDCMTFNNSLEQREANKRLWWSAYWLDLYTSVETNRPTMVDEKDCDVEYPTRLESEDDDTGDRLNFCIYSIKLMRIRKDITKNLPVEQPGQTLLSAVSRFENALTNWIKDLPKALRFPDSDNDYENNKGLDENKNFEEGKICTTYSNNCNNNSTRNDIMLILNIQYQTTWIMLHRLFLPEQGKTAAPVALLSLNVCTKSANTITKMLASQNVNWCQLGIALDGVVASVAIHQLNALSHEMDVANLAQHNLIATVDILKACPLIYMDKVNKIIASIQDFLEKNNLPENIDNIPPNNEDLINQQSMSSVFYPDEFLSSILSSSSSSILQDFHHNTRHQDQQQHQNQSTLNVPSSSFGNNNYNIKSGTPSPSLLFPPTSSRTNSRSTSLTSTPSLLATPVPISISSSPHPPIIYIQRPTVTTSSEKQLHEQHTNNAKLTSSPVPVTIGHNQQQHHALMVHDTSNLLFDNYNGLMGYNNYTSPTMQTTEAINATSESSNNDSGNNNNNINSFFMGFNTASSTTPSETFAQNMFAAGVMGGENSQLFTSNHNSSNSIHNGEMFAGLSATDASLLTPQLVASYPPNLINNNTTEAMAVNHSMVINNNHTVTQQQQFFAIQQVMMRRYHQQQQNQGHFDPNLFFNQFDPTTVTNMNAALLESPVAMQQQQQPSYIHYQQFDTMSDNNNNQQQQNHQSIENVFAANSINNNHTGTTTTLPVSDFLQTEASRKRMRE
ncbi:fungal-specific transcription factor domain-containing protein [Circinella umbellata]|nr:fungal-specific transcription factor domain-containing protein [Circinella umbellata]